ncbi:MAG: hypothetical protein ACKVX7_19240 [Planctomycetota bacterium]
MLSQFIGLSRRRASALLWGVLIALASGCALTTRTLPLAPIVNPLSHVKEIRLTPIISTDHATSLTWTDCVRDHLLRVKGIERVVIGQSGASTATNGVVPATLKAADAAEARLEIRVLSFNPFYPPSASVEVEFDTAPGPRGAPRDGMFLERRGTAHEPAAEPAAPSSGRFQLVLRAEDSETAALIQRYAWSQGDHDRGYAQTDRILRVSDRYIDFVAYQCVQETFARLNERNAPRVTPTSPAPNNTHGNKQ